MCFVWFGLVWFLVSHFIYNLYKMKWESQKSQNKQTQHNIAHERIKNIIIYTYQRSIIGQSISIFLIIKKSWWATIYIFSAHHAFFEIPNTIYNCSTRLETRTKEFNWSVSRSNVMTKCSRRSESNLIFFSFWDECLSYEHSASLAN